MYNPPYDLNRRAHRHWIGIGFLVVFAVFVAAMIYFMFQYGSSFVSGTPGYPPYFWFPFGFFWVFFLFFLLFGVLRFALWGPWRWGGYYRHYGSYGRPNEAYHILRERYARGEITKDQYESMMRDLYQQPPQAPPRT